MNMKEFFKKYTKQSKKGFTMVEMIAVIVILSIASTATLSIFLAVQTTVRDTSTVTTQQYSTAQVEKFVRNEFQTASSVDVYPLNGTLPKDTFSGELNDEFLYYDWQTQQLIFTCYNEDGSTHRKLVIDQVEDVTMDICPLNYSAVDTDNMPLKLIYKIKTQSYKYSGGIVLGNSYAGDSDTLKSASYLPGSSGGNTYSIHWYVDLSNPDSSPMDSSNQYCITFHSVSTEVSTDTP